MAISFNKVDASPYVRSLEKLKNQIGDLPEKDVKCCFKKYHLLVDVADIPQSFVKYFALMSSHAGNGLAGKSLLDFGCGLGVFVSQAAKIGMISEGFDTFTEYSGNCLIAAKCISLCVTPDNPPAFTTVDLVSDSIIRSADFVTSFGALEHIYGVEARSNFLKNMMNCLRPGGVAILTCGPNKRFPIDLFHYGPKFIFYHWLPVKLKVLYLRFFSNPTQCQNPMWLSGMSVNEISTTLKLHGAASVRQVFPLWISLSQHKLLNNIALRWIAIKSAQFLTLIKAEPVIILVAEKRDE